MESPFATEIIEFICENSLFIIFIQRCEAIPPFPVLILTPCPKQVRMFLVLFSDLAEGEVSCEVTKFTANENALSCGAGTN